MRIYGRRCWMVLLAASVALPPALLAQSSTTVGNLPIADLQKLADAGDPAAQNELGVRYRLGSDVEKDPAAAVSWFRKAARQGYGRALFNVGTAYYNGDGVTGARRTALCWFLLAEDADDPSGKQAVKQMETEVSSNDRVAAYVTIGDAYVQGADVKQDYLRAMHWYQKAADDKSGAACQRIASLYARGRGVPQDNAKIIEWLQRAADLGDPTASYDLGKAYEHGTGVPEDTRRAATLYERAAQYANPGATFALGKLYQEGRGVKPYQEQALMWFLLADAYGNPEAANQVATLSAKLKPDQVTKAKADATRFRRTQSKSLTLVSKQPD